MATTPLDFTGKVAVVTGAGRGLGQAYAMLLAARGAAVVVNDLGALDAGGSGRDESLARGVADEIVAAGGRATANGDDVSSPEGAARLVRTAVETFGGLDVLVLNAGIFGLDAFPELGFDALERFFAVHVGGSYLVAQAAWPHLARTGHGRIVLTTSTSTFGAANTVAYTTAKSAVTGLGRALARVGEPEGIKVNMIAPTASTRMMAIGAGRTEPIEDPGLSTDLVAPLVAVLSHESCPTTAEIYAGGVRRYTRLVYGSTIGYSHPDLDVTPEALIEHWDEIGDEAGLEILGDVYEFSRFNYRHLPDLG